MSESKAEDERKIRRIEELLEKHDLYVMWHQPFLSYRFRVEDKDGKRLFGGNEPNARMFRDSLLGFLEDYEEGSVRPKVTEE